MLTANAIASYYDVSLNDFRDDIYSALQQSRENAGKHGKSRWAYFDGYMSDYIASAYCDTMAHRDFERNAY